MIRYFTNRFVRTFLFSLALMAFFSSRAQKLVDASATAETKALFSNLITLSHQGILFGHHEDEAYGSKWIAEQGRSDVKDVCGSYPAVHGWDVGKEDRERNIDGVRFADMHHWIKDVFDRGGINTISWHVDNPVSGSGAWDTTTKVVAHILPGGKHHEAYLKRLDLVATFLGSCKSGDTSIPIIFRPFHEHNGSWFWWGKGNCTEKEFVQLWQFTVGYLKNKKELHNILYAFSPDRSRFDMRDLRKSYFYGYPGDEYVDIIGLDNYMDAGILWNKKPKAQQIQDLVAGLENISQIAVEKQKVAALTETGLEGLTDSKWFTEVMLNPIKRDKNIMLSYLMVWRNANEKHYYAPYPGHPAVADFIGFYNDPYTIFEVDLQNMYSARKPLLKN